MNVGGLSQERVPDGIDQNSSHAFLGLYARAMVATCPVLGKVKVLRQWAGCYDLTPDSAPIVGGIDEIEHFYQASGFVGAGLMFAGLTDWCGMGMLLAKMPWNQRGGGSCCAST